MHDTRYLKIQDVADGLWLGAHHATRNGNLYPMHGLGPLAWYMNLNRGDRLDFLVSMSTAARGMDLYAAEHLPPDHPKRRLKYINGDVNVSLIQTASGRQITLKHDTDLPRPYSRTNLVQGTRGIVRGFPEFLVCLEKADSHERPWEKGEKYTDLYEHPLWKLAREVEAATDPATLPLEAPLDRRRNLDVPPRAGAQGGRLPGRLPPGRSPPHRRITRLRRLRRRLLERQSPP